MTTQQNIKIRRGEDVTLSGTVVDANGSAVDITGATITLTVKESLDASSNVFQNSGSIVVAGSGTFTITIADTDTSSLDLTTRYYDVRILVGGNYSVLTTGLLVLLPEVT